LKGEAQERWELKEAPKGRRELDTNERVAKPCGWDFLGVRYNS
jgi:hypothetical protein